MNTLNLSHLGPIQQANIEFGDLTILVGPQATGKSIFMQLFKLLCDAPDIQRKLKRYGFNWSDKQQPFLELYFGEGLGNIWNEKTKVSFNQKEIKLDDLLHDKQSSRKESVFLVPAQRVLIFQNGWPRPFMSYEAGDPYALKTFSENIRLLMEQGLGGKDNLIFPQMGRFKKELRQALVDHVFRNGHVTIDKEQPRKRIVLEVGKDKLPFMTWSAGQKEFTPLMLGLYWLMPPSAGPKKSAVDWVILEEPEMGLHPRAMSAVMLFCLELIHRGYKVIVSTHSSQMLDLIWALKEIQSLGGTPEDVLAIFELEMTQPLKQLAAGILRKNFKSWFFQPHPHGVVAQDISSLDPGADDAMIRTWGELTDFPSRVSDIIARLYSDKTEQDDIPNA